MNDHLTSVARSIKMGIERRCGSLSRNFADKNVGQFVVYQITNTSNGKRYIGYTSKTLHERWEGHVKDARLGSQTHFHSAIRKYGKEVFSLEVLFLENTSAEAKETEILMILDRSPEYNKTFGGDGTHGHPVTDETREKIRRNTPVRSGENHPLFGKKRPDIVERNKSRKGVKNPNMARKGENNPWFGTKGPMEGRKGSNHPSFGRIVSEETRARQSASAKLRCLRDGPPRGGFKSVKNVSEECSSD